MPKKLKKPKSLKRIGRDINRGFKKAEDALGKVGSDIGKTINKQVLPTLVSAGIPLASSALGMLGTQAGLPPELTSELSENLMKGYIPKEYQTNNKYVGLLGDALQSAISGNPDEMIESADNMMGAISSDLISTRPHKPLNPIRYNPDSPYDDLIQSTINSMTTYNPIPQTSMRSGNDIDNTTNDALYTTGKMNNNKLINPMSPYQQKEGNASALMGGTIKKRRGRPKKIKEIYTKELPNYKRFTHSKNNSLDQLLEANEYKQKKNSMKALNDMVKRQNAMLSDYGY